MLASRCTRIEKNTKTKRRHSMTDDTGAAAGRYRSLHGAARHVANTLLAAITVLGGVWAAELHRPFGWAIFKEQFLALMLGIGLAAGFVAVKAHRREHGRGVPWHDWIAAAAALAAGLYVTACYPALLRSLAATTPDRWLLGGIAVALALEMTRRLSGWSLVVLAIAFILYARYSHLFPGVFNAPSTGWERLFAYLYLDTNGLLGLPINVAIGVVLAFVLFGRVLTMLGADQILTNFALALMGRYRGGPAKVAVIGSSLFGMVSGSAVSNVVIDGPITIPMMTRAGYRPTVAAAIEAVASTGGQIMPPVMGVTAFIMADYLSIPYAEVLIAAALPAILYYVALFAQVDLEAGKYRLHGLARDQIPMLAAVLRGSATFVLPIALLIFALVVLGWEPGKAAMAAIVLALAVGCFQPGNRPTPARIAEVVVGTGRTMLDLIAITALAGIVIGTLQVSGLAFGLSLILVKSAGGIVFALLAMTAVVCMVLGMGLPTTVIYILLAAVAAPAMVDLGLPEISVHLFLFYFGMLSMITPPVCLATFAAASIAGCDMWRAGWQSVRIGVAAYLIPFLFVYQPELLMIGSPGAIALSFATACAAVWFLAVAFVGFARRPLPPAARAAMLAASVLLVPNPLDGWVELACTASGLVIGAAVLWWDHRGARAMRAA